MIRPTLFSLCVVFLAVPLPDVFAEPEIVVSGHVRAREEVKLELFSPGDPTGENSFDEAHLRSRIRFDATANDQVGAVVEFQDVRLLGSEGSTTADTEGVDLKRGAIIVTPTDSEITVKVGRWVMAYGDQRLIGHLEWVDQGRSYDGAHISYAPKNLFIDAFAVRVRETLAAGNDLHFGGLYGGLKLGGGSKLEGTALMLRDTMGPNTQFTTLGSRFEFARAPIDAAAEAAVQLGTLQGDDHLAVALAAKADYTILPDSSLKVGGEIAFASGDGDPADGESGTFQTLFPTNHGHYGIADLVAWQNVLTFRVGIAVKPSVSTWVKLDAHHHRLADPAGGWVNAAGAQIRPGDADASSELGNEIDVVVGWKPLPALSFQAGLGAFLSGGFVDDTGGGGNALFAYALLATSFSQN